MLTHAAFKTYDEERDQVLAWTDDIKLLTLVERLASGVMTKRNAR